MAGAQGKGVVDALTNTYTDIAKMMLLPDAQQHAKFLQAIQQAIQQYIVQQAHATTAQPGGAAGGMGGPGGGMGAGPNPGGPGAPPAMGIAPGGGAGMSGLMGAASQNPDELRRMLAGSSGPPG